MEYQVTKDSAMDTDFLDATGEVVYSTRTPLTFKTMITTLRKRAQDGVMEEIAWIRWHRLSHAELVYDGQTYDATKFLKTPPLHSCKTFSGSDGLDYTWKINGSKEELRSGSGQIAATYTWRNLIKRTKATFQAESSVMDMLDLVILTWVYFEGEREQTAV